MDAANAMAERQEAKAKHLSESREPLVGEHRQAGVPAGVPTPQFRTMNCKNASHWESLFSGAAASPDANLRFVAVQFPDPWSKKKHKAKRTLVDEAFAEMLLGRMAGASPGEKLEGTGSACPAVADDPLEDRFFEDATGEDLKSYFTRAEAHVGKEHEYVFDGSRFCKTSSDSDAETATSVGALYLSSDREDLFEEMRTVFDAYQGVHVGAHFELSPFVRLVSHPLPESGGTERDVVSERLHRPVYRGVAFVKKIFSGRGSTGGTDR